MKRLRLHIAAVLTFLGGFPISAETLERFQDCDVCPEMVALPLGSFILGAPLEESAFVWSLSNKPEPGEVPGWRHEGPEHQVLIDIPIAMGRNEVTRAEWMACVAEDGCSHTPDPRIITLDGDIYADDPRHPVIDVSYMDMLEYVEWLNLKTGTTAYRIPTEAEWEYAARAGTQTKFAQGDTLTRDQANIAVFEFQGDRYVPAAGNEPMPVLVDDLDAANKWGLRHMAGNVLELTATCRLDRHAGLATSSAYLADVAPPGGCRRAVKGGSFGRDPEYARAANRGSGSETHRSTTRGFRVIKDL